MRFAFGEDEVKRIARVVRQVEQDRGSSNISASGPRHTGAHMALVKVTTVASPYSTGNRVDFVPGTSTIEIGDEIRIKEVNGQELTDDNYYVGFFTGYTSTGFPIFLVSASGSGAGGGNASIEVVTDVTCTPTGLEVSTVTLSGANYDNAVIRNFLALSDVTPKSFLGNQGRAVVVNSKGTALEFGPIVSNVATTFISLSDVPNTYGSNNTYKVLTVSSNNASISFSDNNVATGFSITGGGNPNNPTTYKTITLVNDMASPGALKFYSTNGSNVKGWHEITLDSVTNFPNYDKAYNQVLTVNGSATGLIWSDFEFTNLKDCPNSYGGEKTKTVKVKSDETGLEFSFLNFTELGDSPQSFTGESGKVLACKSTEDGLEFIEVNLTTIQSGIATLQSDLSTLQSDFATTKTDVSTLQSDVSSLQTDMTTAQIDITSVQNDVTTIQTDLTTLQSDVSTLQTGLSTAESNITTLQSDVSTLQSNITTLQGDVSTLQTNMTTAEGNITSLQSDVSTLQTSMTAAQGDITTLQTGLTTAEGNITTLQSDVATLQTDLATAQSNITTLQTDLATAQSDIATLQSDLATAQSNISTLQSDYSALEARVTAGGL